MGQHVLLIEDEANIAEAIRFILSREGLRVSTHADGADAVARLRELAPDLLILDVMLPGKSGFDVLRELRADAATAGLPVIMLTARSQQRDRAAAAHCGVDAFLTKPFSNAELLATVQKLVSR